MNHRHRPSEERAASSGSQDSQSPPRRGKARTCWGAAQWRVSNGLLAGRVPNPYMSIEQWIRNGHNK